MGQQPLLCFWERTPSRLEISENLAAKHYFEVPLRGLARTLNNREQAIGAQMYDLKNICQLSSYLVLDLVRSLGLYVGSVNESAML